MMTDTIYALHDFSYAEIAEMCGCSKYAVRDSIVAALERLQRKIDRIADTI